MENNELQRDGQHLKAGLAFCRAHWIWLVLVVAFAFYMMLIPTFQVGAWTDDGFYINFARSLAQGRGMRLIHLSGAPVDMVVPPGYPLLLSPLVLIFQNSFLPMQILSALFTLGSIYLLYNFCRPRFPLIVTVLIVGLFAFNPTVASGSIWVMSEAPFVFFMCLSLVLIDRLVAQKDVSKKTFLFTVFATSALILVRYFGLPLFGGAIAYVLYRRRDRLAWLFTGLSMAFVIVVTVAFGGAAAWERYSTVGAQLLTYITPQSIEATASTASVQSVGGFWGGLWRNLVHLVTYALPMSVVPLFGGPRVMQAFASLGLAFMPTLLSLLVTLMILIGYIVRLRRGFTVAEVFPVIYCGFLLVVTQGQWPDSGSASRYIFPMIPFALLYFVQALVALSEILGSWVQGPAKSIIKMGLPIVAVTLLLLLYWGRNIQAMVDPVRDRIPDVSLGATWIAENTSEDAVVMVEVPRVHALYARRTTVPFPDGSYEAHKVYGDEECVSVDLCLDEALEQYAVDYVLISYAISSDLPFHHSSYVETNVWPFLQGHPERFESVFTAENGMIEVFKVLDQ